MDVKGTKYYWSINASDGTAWVNNTYYFTAYPFIFTWSFNIDTNTTNVGPLAADINGDGLYEIFVFGKGKLFCLNGSNGEVIWSYFNIRLGEHSQAEIGDLNNDGIPEIVISAGSRTIALHANNGSVYWIANAASSNKNIIIADLDGNRYPYVFIASDDVNNGLNGTGRLRKLRGTDGTVLAETFAWRPCYGSLSLADLNNDGKFEILISDRAYSYKSGQFGRGIQSYDAETLELLWYQDSITCSSHSAALIDVNNDGILDAVVLQQSGGGIYVIDGATREKMPGKWQNSISGLVAHSQFSIHDIDGDGNLELIACSDSPAIVWDLGRWQLDATLATAFEPPMMGNVIGDENLEIILASGNQVYIYDRLYQLIETINARSIANVLVQDIDNDGRNELILMTKGLYSVYKTSGRTEEHKPRTTSGYYSERRTAVATYIPPPGAPQPIIKAVTPVNNSQDVTINPVIGAWVIDFHYDLMNITISTNASGDWENLATYTNVGNGWYNITPTGMNQPQTTYYWRVTAVDPYADNLTTTETFQFTTSISPEISDISANPAVAFQEDQVTISAHVTDNDRVEEVKVRITHPDGTTTNTTLPPVNQSWTVLRYDSFEEDWGNYMPGGTYCTRNTNQSYAKDGNVSALLRHYSDTASSLILSEPIDGITPRYTSLKVDFWFYTRNFGVLENFWVKYWDGKHWRIVDNYIRPGSLGSLPGDKPFQNGAHYNGVTWINATEYPFHNDMKIRFECDASSSTDYLYIDHIYITATQLPSLYTLMESFQLPGQYTYSIWCKDISGNTNQSQTFSFEILENTNVNSITPYEVTTSPLTITATGDSTLDNVTLWYRWSDDNFTRWYDNDWKYRKELTVNSSQVPSDLVNFPILVSITDSNLSTDAQSNGHDILFTDDARTKLNHEIELYNHSNGQLIAWVNVPHLSGTKDTRLYIYYGNPDCDNQENVSGTWDSHYLAVHHFSETTGQHIDSTAYGNDTVMVNVTLQGSATGVVGGANYFDGTADFIQLPAQASAAGKTEVTIEMWIKPDTWTLTNTMYDEWNASNYWQFTITQNKFYTRDTSTGTTGTRNNDLAWTTTPATGSWHHIAFWYSVSNNAKKLFLNGAQDASTSVSIDQLTSVRNTSSPRIGYASDGTNYSGYLDEFRISNTARSADWILTTYATISNTTTFISIGEQEEGIVGNETDWMIWDNASNPDDEYPWSWTFDFPNGTGYYEFYSIGRRSDLPIEKTPEVADAKCFYMTL